MVAAYRRAKNFNPVEIKKWKKAATRGDARCLAVPHFSARRRALKCGTA